MRQVTHTLGAPAVVLACCALISACGGGGGGSGGGAVQTISFDFPSTPTLATTPTLTATASSGLPVTFSSQTPAICTVTDAKLSMLTQGECKITASQAGGSGYEPVSVSQLFIVRQTAQKIVAPLVLPLFVPPDGTPVTLTATATSGLPVTFTTDTPDVCTVSGTQVIGLANGHCDIIANQAGNDQYSAAASVSGQAVVGNAPPPVLTLASGYVPGGNAVNSWQPTFAITNTTIEGGAVTQGANGYLAGWGWGKNGQVNYSVANGNFISSFVVAQSTLDAITQGWEKSGSMTVGVLAPGLDSLKTDGDTAGLQVGLQTQLTFNMAQNAEWVATGDNTVNVDLYLGKLITKADGSTCNVKLRGVVVPTVAAATDYTLNLADLTVSESCGQTLTNADVPGLLQGSPIVEMEISTAGNINVRLPDTNGDTNYSTFVTLGPVTIH